MFVQFHRPAAGATVVKGFWRQDRLPPRISSTSSKWAVCRPVRKTYNSGRRRTNRFKYSPRDKSVRASERRDKLYRRSPSSRNPGEAPGRRRTNVSSTTRSGSNTLFDIHARFGRPSRGHEAGNRSAESNSPANVLAIADVLRRLTDVRRQTRFRRVGTSHRTGSSMRFDRIKNAAETSTLNGSDRQRPSRNNETVERWE